MIISMDLRMASLYQILQFFGYERVHGLIGIMSEISLTRFLGTPIPSALTLFRDRSYRFSLQPSRPTNVNGTSNDDSYAERADPIQI